MHTCGHWTLSLDALQCRELYSALCNFPFTLPIILALNLIVMMYSLSDLIGEYVKQSFSVYFGKSDNNNKSKTFQAFYRNLVSTIVSKLFSLFWWRTLLWNMSSNSVSTDAFWHAGYLQCFMFWFPLCAVFCSSSKVMVWTSCIKLQFHPCTHIVQVSGESE